MTKKTLEKLPEKIRVKIEDYKAKRKRFADNHIELDKVRSSAYAYTTALCDVGFITDRERQILFIYTTV